MKIKSLRLVMIVMFGLVAYGCPPEDSPPANSGSGNNSAGEGNSQGKEPPTDDGTTDAPPEPTTPAICAEKDIGSFFDCMDGSKKEKENEKYAECSALPALASNCKDCATALTACAAKTKCELDDPECCESEYSKCFWGE